MGIDLQQYRVTIGNFNNFRVKKYISRYHDLSCMVSQKLFTLLLYTLSLVYLIPLLLSMHILSPQSEFNKISLSLHSKSADNNSSHVYLSIICISRTFSKTIIKKIFQKTPFFTSIYLFLVFFPSSYFWNAVIVDYFTNSNCLANRIRTSLRKLVKAIMASGYIILLSIAPLLLFLIVVSNISLLNPGPTKDQHLNCYFHNVQGFVTLNSVGRPYPDLNITKLLEFQAYIFQNTPDIVILNETWLNSCINDKEIIPGDTYKIFRKDRSCLSHPLDPQNSNKFKRNGGGVLIAFKNSLNLCPKEIKTTCKAEILSIELTLPNKKKISISTHYRVGTLGVTRINKVKQHLHNIFRFKKYKNNFIVGDINLESVNWHTNSSNNNLQSSYVSLFADIGVSQLIFEPTHRSGNILDILLSNTPDLVDNIAVHPHGCFTYSDHSPLK